MRLLHIETLKFEEFPGPAPRYAIASHRWSECEATYEDVLHGQNVETYGYRKISRLCSFIRENKELCPVDWVWIDTCCINKTSTAELAEAILSMFRWYAEAFVCITYMHDVPSTPVGGLKAFRASVWFTRGWTLQELLAPQFILFLDEGWKVFGHKHGRYADSHWTDAIHVGMKLNSEIAKVAMISEHIIDDYSSSEGLTVDQKLAWMHGRMTTRIEDRAYCMFGICDVFIPVLYGEREHAMTRLANEVKSRSKARIVSSYPTAISQLEAVGEVDLERPSAMEEETKRRETTARADRTQEQYAYLLSQCRLC